MDSDHPVFDRIEQEALDAARHAAIAPAPREETVNNPVSAAFDAIAGAAGNLEHDAAANPLAVIIAARHVGLTLKPAQCIAVADFIHAIEEEARALQAPLPQRIPQNGRTGPQQVMQ